MQPRRRFLKVLGVGGLAGASGVALGTPAQARESVSEPSTRSLTLVCPTLDALSGRSASNPAVGTVSVLTGELETIDGASAGTVHIVRTVVRSGVGEELTFSDQQVFDLAEGRLTGAGLSTRHPDLVDGFALTGGTGEYAGVRGSYSMEHDDWTMGGDGTVRFVIRLDEGIR